MKDKIDALLKELDSLGLGVDSGDTAHEAQPTRSAPVLTSVNLILIDRAFVDLSTELSKKSETSFMAFLIASRM
jgi:hypothetical protein